MYLGQNFGVLAAIFWCLVYVSSVQGVAAAEPRMSLEQFVLEQFGTNVEPETTTATTTTTTATTTTTTTPTMTGKFSENDLSIFRQLVETEIFTTTLAPIKANVFENSQQSCECTPYYRCDDNRVITDDDEDDQMFIDLDLRMAAIDDCPLLRPCCKKILENAKIPKRAEIIDRCGVRLPNGLGFKIINQPNHQAQEAEFPWTVVVKNRNANNGSDSKCGGSLIHPNVVMTVAHCVCRHEKFDTWFIRAGEWQSISEDEFYPHQDRAVERVIVHERFHLGSARNDIALLILKTPVSIAENVNTICLPPKDYNFDGQRCFASGWGAISWEDPKLESIMKHIELPIVERQQCQQKLRTTRVGSRFRLHNSFICAGGEEGVDMCYGDGGSPLVCAIPNTVDQYYQAGIVSWGVGCHQPIPAVYANVAHLRDWIDKQMEENNFQTSSYSQKNSA